MADDSLPTFLVIGAMKAGTTSLWNYLRARPDVFMPELKEPDFFVAEKTWSRGLSWYRWLFNGANESAARGEASTNYAKHPFFGGVPERIAGVLPDIRLVYVVRHPMERIRSQYLHGLRAGWERLSLERAVVENPQYVDISSYAMQLDRYFDHFDQSQVLVVTAEALRSSREATVAKVVQFIGADPAAADRAMDEEFHASAGAGSRRPVADVVDRVPGRMLARRLLPAPVRGLYTRLTALDHPSRLKLSSDAEQRLLDRLRPDAARLKAMLGPEFGWDLA